MNAKNRKSKLLNDQELDAILNQGKTPSNSAQYIKTFPNQVIKKLDSDNSTEPKKRGHS